MLKQQKKVSTSSPVAAPATPVPTSSAPEDFSSPCPEDFVRSSKVEHLYFDPVIEVTHSEEPTMDAASTPEPTPVGSKNNTGEPKGKDPVEETFAENLSSNPGA